MKKVSQLLTGEGIDTDELGNHRPDTGCVLIDLAAGEDLVHQTQGMVPMLPQILVTSTQTLGGKQLEIADEFVSTDMPDEEIIRRVQCMQNMAIRLTEEVPEPAHTRVLLDGDTEEEEAPLHALSGILNDAEIEWEPLTEEKDPEGTGLVYTLYRRQSYARLLQGDYPGYVHIQMAPTPELRVEALTVGDISYTPKSDPEEIVVRHKRFLHMLERLRNPDAFRKDPLDERALQVLFVFDRNTGTTLRNSFGDDIEMKAQATTAGAIAQAKNYDVVLIHPGGKDDAKERLSFLQMLLKAPNHPPLGTLFHQVSAPADPGILRKEGRDADRIRELRRGSADPP